MRRFLLSLAALLAAGPALAQQSCITTSIGPDWSYTSCSDGTTATSTSIGPDWTYTVVTPPYQPPLDPTWPALPQPDPWGIDAPPP